MTAELRADVRQTLESGDAQPFWMAAMLFELCDENEKLEADYVLMRDAMLLAKDAYEASVAIRQQLKTELASFEPFGAVRDGGLYVRYILDDAMEGWTPLFRRVGEEPE